MNNESLFDSVSVSRAFHYSNPMHKSYSMHLRNDVSPERGSLLRVKSSSSEDDDEEPVVRKFSQTESNGFYQTNQRKLASTDDIFSALLDRHRLLTDLDEHDQCLIMSADQHDSRAGLLFSTNSEICRKVTRSVSQSLIQTKDEEESSGDRFDSQRYDSRQSKLQNSDLLLIEPNLDDQCQSNHDVNAALLNASRFGEDAQILQKLESHEQKPNFSNSIENVGLVGLIRAYDVVGDGYEASSSDDARNTDQMSENITDPSESNPSHDGDHHMACNVTSTPNFKLASLINDASNLQWSRWTSSQNPKSVYKGIKSAATGIVSHLQEIKSSFSISNSATPSKLLTTAQHRSNTTRELISQWANYFSSQPTRNDYEDSFDSSSEASNDLFRLSNEEDIEPSSIEASDFRACHKLFDALEKHYNNASSKEDLIDHVSADDESLMEHDQVAIEIKITTCSRCNVCHSLLYDEEIMERWSHNESNLNTRCIYCRAKIVPLMSIEVDDFRFRGQPQSEKEKPSRQSNQQEEKTDDKVTDDLVDLSPEGCETNGQPGNNQTQEANSGKRKRNSQSISNYEQHTFIVPYLSPIVLRKELESVFESSGETCPASSRFIDEHPIIYWNLLWYFSRINVPTHLALLCLNSKSILKDRIVPKETQSLSRVVVRTLWDNDKLYAHVGKPLYRLLELGEPSMRVEAILCDNLHFRKRFLDQVINLIKTNELQKAMNLVLNTRLKSSTRFILDKNRHNLYRDLIFLIKTYLGPRKLYMGKLTRPRC